MPNKKQRVNNEDLDAIHSMNTIEDQQMLPQPMEVNYEIPENLSSTLLEETLIVDQMPQVSTPIQDNAQLQCLDRLGIRSPLPKLKKVQKKTVIKKKLMFDKFNKIPGISMDKSWEEYEKSMVSLISI